MEMMWPILAVMVPLFAGGVVALVMYARYGKRRRGPTGADVLQDVSSGNTEPSPSTARSRPSALAPWTMSLCFAGLALAVLLALIVGFPLVRTLLMAIHAPIAPG